jgi:hypothetical protein
MKGTARVRHLHFTLSAIDLPVVKQLTFGSQRGPGRLPPATREKLGQFVREKGLATVQKEVAHSIIVANQADSSKWGLRLNQRDIMLNR